MQYQTPINDIRFILYDVLGIDSLQQLEHYNEATTDVVMAVFEEMGKFAAGVIQPTNKTGDEQGCEYDPQTHTVTTPDGFKAAYEQFAQAGWTGLDAPVDFGGQGLQGSDK